MGGRQSACRPSASPEPAPAQPNSAGGSHRTAPKSLLDRWQQFLHIFGDIGVESYEPQQKRSDIVPDHPDVPECRPLSIQQWNELAEAEQEQKDGLAAQPVEKLSNGALDQEKFIAQFKKALAKSQEVELTLDDQHLRQFAQAASQQSHIKSFDDFIYFDFTHESMDDVAMPVKVSRKLETFRDECARNNTQAGMMSFADSRFKQVYTDKESLRAKTREEAWDLVNQFLQLLHTKPGFSVKQSGGKGKDGGGMGRHMIFEPVHALNFHDNLRSSFHSDGIPLTCEDCKPTDKRHKDGWCAGETLVRCWTSTNLSTPLQREFCSLLQAGMRLNDPELAPILARIWATMNVYCVANRKNGGAVGRTIVWPGERHPTTGKPPPTGEEKRILHRGGRVHERAMEWWDDAVASMEVFRVPGAIAVSKLAPKALFFMHTLSRPLDQPKVYFRFHLAPNIAAPCDHAVCLDAVSVLPEEQEFLFPPYSSFQAVAKRWYQDKKGEGYWVIDIKVIKNNQEVSDEVGLCPWI